MSEDDRIYIEELADKLERAPHTIRQWIKRSDFPQELRPSSEGGRNKLYWQSHQISGLETYASERAKNRGFGRAAAAQQ